VPTSCTNAFRRSSNNCGGSEKRSIVVSAMKIASSPERASRRSADARLKPAPVANQPHTLTGLIAGLVGEIAIAVRANA
jgi:hypothetical protein